jgi:hypothetical protein
VRNFGAWVLQRYIRIIRRRLVEAEQGTASPTPEGNADGSLFAIPSASLGSTRWAFRESVSTSRLAILKNDQLHNRLRFHGSLVLQTNQKRRSVDFRFAGLGACFVFSELSIPEWM